MTRNALFSLVAVGLLGCTADGFTSENPPPDDDDRNDQLGILCASEVTLAGRFELGAPQPDDVFGCWPVGTWTFSATVANGDCSDTSGLLPEYRFSVTRDGEDETDSYAYLSQPGYERVRLSVSSGGGGLCEGNLEVYSPDGKILVNLKPALQADGSIDGSGEYEVYGSDQW
jgi:hypothetical protein